MENIEQRLAAAPINYGGLSITYRTHPRPFWEWELDTAPADE